MYLVPIPRKCLLSGKATALLLLFIFCSLSVQATDYNLSTGLPSYPPCVSGTWSVSGSTYTCSNRVTLVSGDTIVANINSTIVATNGFTLAGNTIGSAAVNINLTSTFATGATTGTNTIYGNVSVGVGSVTGANVTVNGTLTVSQNVDLTGGAVTGLLTSNTGFIKTAGTNLNGGARSNGNMNISGGTMAGSFISDNGSVDFSGVTMTSGSINGANSVTIQNSSVLGSASSSITVTTKNNPIFINNSIVYGNLTAPSYATVNVINGAAVYGTCLPNSTPANACGAPPPTICPAGISSGITGKYYNNQSLTDPSMASRTDAPIDFNWGAGAPGPSGITANNFSTRWSGYVRVTQSGNYRFQTVSDDGVRLYVNGTQVINRWNVHAATTDTTVDIPLVAGQAYTIVLEYYENGGDATIRLHWLVPGASSYVPIPGGPTPTLGAGLYECTPTAKPPVSSCPTNAKLVAGITGNYFNNRALTAPVTATRLDGPINFDWGTGVPGPVGIGVDNFSVRWDGYIYVTQTGVHRFQTNSDDGVRLTVNGDLLIDQWNDHAATIHTSAAVNLEAGKVYPIKLEFYENGGFAVAQLRWQTPGSSSYVAIPIGVTAASVSVPGLYECVSTPGGYLISNNPSGLTCAAEQVMVTALNAVNAAYNPPAGTQVTLTTNPASGVWVGSNLNTYTYTFLGGENHFIAYLQQTTPATLVINATSTTATGSSSIAFADVGLKIAANFLQSPPASPPPVVNQIAGIPGTARLKVIRKDDNTGACVAQVGVGTRPVSLAYTCVNPTTCIPGQAFTVNGNGIAANHNGAGPSYSSVNLTFDNNGEAPLAINYSDVGQVRLSAQLSLPAAGNNPAITLIGGSDLFVVKPQSIVVSGVQRLDGTSNPGGTSASGTAAQFVAAGEQFKVLIEARNGANPAALTPNFGRELTPETQNLKIKTKSLIYPAGGTATDLTVSSAIASTTPQGTFLYGDVRWDQVGSIVIEPHFDDGNATTTNDGDYLGAGNIENLVPSSIVGRFYPDRYVLVDTDPVETCPASPLSFHYMGKIFNDEDDDPNTEEGLVFKVQALDKNGNPVSNYDSAKGYGTASVDFHTFSGSTDFSSRLVDNMGNELTPGAWINGQMDVNHPEAQFGRETTPDGPYTDVTIGIGIEDCLDMRELVDKNLTLDTTANCGAPPNNAYELAKFDALYGRLRLDDAFGPETAALPVNFYTEYWITTNASTGEGRFITNGKDSCTIIPHAAVTYSQKDGTALSPGTFVMPLNGGETTGVYPFGLPINDYISFIGGDAGHYFTAPTNNARGDWNVDIELSEKVWLRYDWNQDGTADDVPTARFSFGSYRGHDRVIYWRERLQ